MNLTRSEHYENDWLVLCWTDLDLAQTHHMNIPRWQVEAADAQDADWRDKLDPLAEELLDCRYRSQQLLANILQPAAEQELS